MQSWDDLTRTFSQLPADLPTTVEDVRFANSAETTAFGKAKQGA
jgi:hypothetical protein